MIVRLCEGGPLPTGVLSAKAGGISRQGLAKHLKVLEAAGLVASSRLGRGRTWRVEAARISGARRFLERMSSRWEERLERLKARLEAGD